MIPRRIQVDKLTPAEKAIYDAQGGVEAMPADVRLTKAGTLLQQARDAVADFVDGVESPALLPAAIGPHDACAGGIPEMGTIVVATTQPPQPSPRSDVEHILQFFTWAHLPPHLADVSRPFAEIAHTIVETLPRPLRIILGDGWRAKR